MWRRTAANPVRRHFVFAAAEKPVSRHGRTSTKFKKVSPHISKRTISRPRTAFFASSNEPFRMAKKHVPQPCNGSSMARKSQKGQIVCIFSAYFFVPIVK